MTESVYGGWRKLLHKQGLTLIITHSSKLCLVNMARSLVLFACLLLVPSLVCGSFFYTTLRKHKLALQPEVPPTEIPPDTWFQQRLDHFDPHDSRMWLQRYFINDTFWDHDSGPVFLNIEGEGEASPQWVLKGEMMVNAQRYKALAVSLEHR